MTAAVLPLFAIIPATVLLDKRLGLSHLRVYAALALHATNKSRTCCIGHARISEISGYSLKSIKYVSDITHQLADFGYLKIKPKGQGESNIYHLLDVRVTADNENLRTVTDRTLSDEEYAEKRRVRNAAYHAKKEVKEIAKENAQKDAYSQSKGYASHAAELDAKARVKGFSSHADELSFQSKAGIYADPLNYSVKYLDVYGVDYVPYEDPFVARLHESGASAVSASHEDADLVGDFSNEFAGEF